MVGRNISRRNLVSAGASGTLASALLGASAAGASTRHLGAAQPQTYRFELGDFEVTTLLDAVAVIDGPWPIVGENVDRSEIERLMVEHLLPPAKFQPGFTPVVLNTGRQIVLFDTGNGETGFVPPPTGGRLPEVLAAAGFSPDDIDIVVLSHCHLDHIGGLTGRGRRAFPRARYVFGRIEHDFWARTDRLPGAAESVGQRSKRLFDATVPRLVERASFVEAGQDVCTGVTALAAFGHTPGHLAFHIESRGKRLLLWHDCVHNEVASLTRPDWHALFDMDKETGVATRKHILDMAATEKLAVVGYHTTFPSIGFVERAGRGYRWIPHSYQLNV